MGMNNQAAQLKPWSCLNSYLPPRAHNFLVIL
jgi:hypothetical protein